MNEAERLLKSAAAGASYNMLLQVCLFYVCLPVKYFLFSIAVIPGNDVSYECLRVETHFW